jgi:hypothetical protein
MIQQDKIAKPPRLFKTLTGLSTEGFRQLLPAFERAWEAGLDRRDAGRLCAADVVAAGAGDAWRAQHRRHQGLSRHTRRLCRNLRTDFENMVMDRLRTAQSQK